MNKQRQNELNDLLLEQIKNLVQGNNASASDMRLTEAHHTIAHCRCTGVWQFEPTIHTNTQTGNHAIEGNHYGFEMNNHNQAVHELCMQARQNRELWMNFISSMVAQEERKPGFILSLSDKAHPVHQFPPLSVHHYCANCRGNGHVHCSSCQGSGKKICYACHGMGQVDKQRTINMGQSQQVQQYRENCDACFGSGKQVCSGCGGNGKEKCNPCFGQGFFTDITQVSVVAKPLWEAKLSAPILQQAAQTWLQTAGGILAGKKLSFTLLETCFQHTCGQTWLATYEASPDLLCIDFTLKGKPYRALAIGHPPYCFSQPPIFDNLLATERKKLIQIFQKKLPGNRQIKALFDHFRTLPALDTMMQAIAETSQKTDEQLQQAVSQSCSGFISNDIALSLGQSLQKVMQRVSPQYFMPVWFVFLSIPALFASVLLADRIAHPDVGLFSALLDLLFFFLLAFVGMHIVAPAACLISSFISAWQRKKLPKPYRQKPRNWLPLKKAKYFAMAGVAAGLLYGLGAKMNLLPPIQLLISQATSLLNNT